MLFELALEISKRMRGQCARQRKSVLGLVASSVRECASTLAAATPRLVTVLEVGYCDFLQERREECREMRDERREKGVDPKKRE